jgi:hypothetical protein
MTTKIIATLAILISTSALAESPYPTPTRDGRQRIQRTGTCPTGYITETPAAMPKIKGAPCPSGTFGSGDACKGLH